MPDVPSPPPPHSDPDPACLRVCCAARSVLFTTCPLREVQSVALPPLFHLLHEVLYCSGMWYLQHQEQFAPSVGLELVKQRCARGLRCHAPSPAAAAVAAAAGVAAAASGGVAAAAAAGGVAAAAIVSRTCACLVRVGYGLLLAAPKWRTLWQTAGSAWLQCFPRPACRPCCTASQTACCSLCTPAAPGTAHCRTCSGAGPCL
jgi:hypothetical protein